MFQLITQFFVVMLYIPQAPDNLEVCKWNQLKFTTPEAEISVQTL